MIKVKPGSQWVRRIGSFAVSYQVLWADLENERVYLQWFSHPLTCQVSVPFAVFAEEYVPLWWR